MLRSRLDDALKANMRAKDKPATATLRLILAALKDRDIAARGKGNSEGISDDDILGLLQSMIKQRRESIDLYLKGGRAELADGEAAEITIIEQFLPEQMNDEDLNTAVETVIADVEASSLKDMGKTMAELKKRFTGQLDSAKASAIVKAKLA